VCFGLRRAGEYFGPGRRFEILDELGAGGAGVVYLAFDHVLGRRIAAKFMREVDGRSSASDARAEARATARLNHENVVTVYDLGFDRGAPYIVMEYLEGEPLSALIGDQRVSALRALEIMIDVARGLAHAHGAGLFHLDLKPSNIFVSRCGRAKILDFGVGSLTAVVERIDTDDFEPGPLVGTPMYMAPEQWGVGKLDGRTDIWAAGMVLYELLTGNSPSPDSAPRFRLCTVGASQLPLISKRLSLPAAMDEVLARALAPAMASRFDSASELLTALERVRAYLLQQSDAGQAGIRRVPGHQLSS
jgi:serine/threonine protein kinase